MKGGVTQTAADVLFDVDQTDSWYVGSSLTTPPAISVNALFYPLSRGFGEVKSLHLAITENTALKAEWVPSPI